VVISHKDALVAGFAVAATRWAKFLAHIAVLVFEQAPFLNEVRALQIVYLGLE
jgi:hypothetical protein